MFIPDIEASLAVPSYVYNEKYHQGKLYMTMYIQGLTTEDPSDFVANKNYQPYTLDLVSKTATKLVMPATNGWASSVDMIDGEIVFPMATKDHNGLFKAGEQEPFMTTQGMPISVVDID